MLGVKFAFLRQSYFFVDWRILFCMVARLLLLYHTFLFFHINYLTIVSNLCKIWWKLSTAFIIFRSSIHQIYCAYASFDYLIIPKYYIFCWIARKISKSDNYHDETNLSAFEIANKKTINALLSRKRIPERVRKKMLKKQKQRGC